MNNHRIAVIGQGYVGLPLALEFAKYFPVYGFDINTKRVQELNSGKDHTLEADLTLLSKVINEANTSGFLKDILLLIHWIQLKMLMFISLPFLLLLINLMPLI